MKNTQINSNDNFNDNIIANLIKLLIESNKQNKDIILSQLNNNYNMIKKSINDLKNDIQNIQKEIKKNKEIKNSYETKDENIDISNNVKSNIQNYKELSSFENLSEYNIETSLNKNGYFVYNNNTFTAFNSLNNIIYLIYAGKNNNSIVCYDLKVNKEISEIKNAHSKFITQIKHYLDNIKKRDILITISYEDKNVKIWNVNNFQCILQMKETFKIYCLADNNENYILSKTYYYSPIKVYDFKGLYKKTIACGNQIETYYDIIQSKNYIITTRKSFIISLDFKTNILYHNYCDNNETKNLCYTNYIINYYDNRIIKLIAINEYKQLKIWNFHSGNLILKTEIEPRIDSILSWNKNYILAIYEKDIKLINLNNGMICLNFKGHENEIVSLQKIILPKIGDCLISQASTNDFIKLWKIK